MNEPVSKRAIGVGFFILVGVFFFVGGVMIIGNLHSTFSKKMNISTVFSDVNGLVAGNNIWFSGVKIGTVKKLEFYGNSEVRVVMNINIESKQYIRKDAKVKISSDGFIGNKILIIYGGTSAVEEVEEGDILHNETTLSTDDIMSTLQQNNLNVLLITQKLVDGEGSIGKLLTSDSIYDNIASTSRSLAEASLNAQKLIAALAAYSSKLNQEGSLANDIATDTVVFNSMRNSILKLQQVADTAGVVVENLKLATTNKKSTVGVLLHDEQAGANMKASLSNLETSTIKLNEDLEALKHSFLLRRYFKKEAKKSGK